MGYGGLLFYKINGTLLSFSKSLVQLKLLNQTSYFSFSKHPYIYILIPNLYSGSFFNNKSIKILAL